MLVRKIFEPLKFDCILMPMTKISSSPVSYFAAFVILLLYIKVQRTRKSGALGSIPGLATYFRFSFRFFKKDSCQLLAKVCARSTGKPLRRSKPAQEKCG